MKGSVVCSSLQVDGEEDRRAMLGRAEWNGFSLRGTDSPVLGSGERECVWGVWG